MTQHVMVVGGSVLDAFFVVDSWPKQGAVSDVLQFQLTAGGKGLNQAVAAHRMGAVVDFVSCVGPDDAGQLILATLRQNSLGHDFVRINTAAQTNVVGVIVQDAEPGFMGMAGASRTLTRDDLAAPLATLQPNDVALINYEVVPQVVNAAILGTKARGAIAVVNPAPLHNSIPDPEPPYASIDVFIPNRFEAAILLRQPHISPTHAVRELLARGVKHVILTLGDDGCLYATDPDHIHHQPAFPTTIVDTTGASDAFCATIAAGWGRYPLPDLIARATAAGALTCQQLGALSAMPTTDQVTDFLSSL